MGKTSASKPVHGKKNKVKAKSKQQKTIHENVDDEIIMLDDDPVPASAPVVDNIVKPVEKDIEAISEEADSSLNSILSESLEDNVSEMNDTAEDDDEVEVVKANIFKFQGALTYEQEVNQDILHFKYFDDFNDEDIIVLEDDVTEMDECATIEETIAEEEKILVNCEECEKLFEVSDLEEHKQVKHPPKKKSIMQFDGGNFFMIAT